jgi:hypothetical protein
MESLPGFVKRKILSRFIMASMDLNSITSIIRGQFLQQLRRHK